MADTVANQAAYPQHRGQQPGVGFPIVRAVTFFDVACGAWTTLSVGPYQGKENGPQRAVDVVDVYVGLQFDPSRYDAGGGQRETLPAPT
jgi:hypothetical protein